MLQVSETLFGFKEGSKEGAFLRSGNSPFHQVGLADQMGFMVSNQRKHPSIFHFSDASWWSYLVRANLTSLSL